MTSQDIRYFVFQDCGDEFADQYTATWEGWEGQTESIGMSHDPFAPNGISMHVDPPDMDTDNHIDWSDLPSEVKAYILHAAYGVTVQRAREMAEAVTT